MRMRRGAFFLGFLLLAAVGSSQTAVWSTASIPTDPTFSSYYTTLNNVGAEVDVTMQQLWAQIGQTFPAPRNWNTSNGFSLSIENTEAFPVSLGFKVDTANGPMTSIFEIPAGQRVRFFIDNSGFSSQATGMDRPLPVFDGYYKHSLVFTPQNLSQVTKWSLYYRQETPARLKISGISGHSVNLGYHSTIDHYGQLSYQYWDGKVQEDLELHQQRDAEGFELAQNPGGQNTWGWAGNQGNVTATGKWRTIKGRNGKQYIATPNGKLFWSVGTTSVTDRNPTIVQNRETMFESLPSDTSPEAAFYGSHNGLKTFDFTTANLSRKYGANWASDWKTRAGQRLKSWGLNTLGTGSDISLMDETNMPALLTITTKDFPVRLNVPWSYWGNFPDPHHSAFTAWLTNRYHASLQYHSRNGRLMGVFVDGENAWRGPDGLAGKYQIPLAALRAGKTQPSKQVFLAQLRTKYPTIQNLNAAWRTNFASWSYMYDNAIEVPGNFTDPQLADFSKFLSTFAAKYYSCVKDAIRASSSNTLFMGSKDAVSWTPTEVHDQAAKYVDIITVTCYGKVQDIDWNYLNNLKKPVMIAEFSFASNDRGPSASTNWMGDLQFDATRRAAEAKAYLDKALTMSNFVGAHWYSYRDNVLSGRAGDTQNYAVGLVDITDRPYDEMAGVFRTFTADMYSQRGFW